MDETLIIGASAAGLAVAGALARRGLPYTVLEATDRVASAWRGHYDRLHLHTPKASSALPGLPMPREWPRYVGRDEVVAYLERYAARFGIAPRFGQRVTRIERGWRVHTADRVWEAPRVVIATGYTRVPLRPTWPGMDAYRGEVLHSSEFRNGAAWKGRAVVVVGFGNSACEQALDCVEHGARVHLAVRSAVNVIPRDAFGLVPVLQLGILTRALPPGLADALTAPLVAWTIGDITRLGLRKAPYGPATQIARDKRIPLLDVGTVARLRAGEIVAHPNVARFTEAGVVFEDGVEVEAAAVILGTGYRPALEDFGSDVAAALGPDGVPARSGAEAAPGLWFCGFEVSPAGMLREIGLEAERIARGIA